MILKDIKEYARIQLKDNYLRYLIISLMQIVAVMTSFIIAITLNEFGIQGQIVSNAIFLLLLPIYILTGFRSAEQIISLYIWEDGKFDVKDILDGYKYYGKYLYSFIAAYAESIILFVIAFMFSLFAMQDRPLEDKIVFLVSFILTNILLSVIRVMPLSIVGYVIADHHNWNAPAIWQEAKFVMRGNRMKFIKLFLSFLGWFILSCCTAGLLYIYTIPYYRVARAGLYRKVVTDKHSK